MIIIHQNPTFIHVRVMEDASLPSLYTKIQLVRLYEARSCDIISWTDDQYPPKQISGHW